MKGFQTVWALSFSFILLFLVNSGSVYAQSSSDSIDVSEWTTYDRESILTDPIAQKILENIEISKQILYDIQNPQRIVTPHELYIEQQRMLVQQQLQEELDRMNKSYANNTPRAAFAKYVAKFPEEYHGYLWELFDYLYSKVTAAREYRDNFLAYGGSHWEAQQVFIEYATITKAERIQFAHETALKYGLINKISNIDDFNALPTQTKQAFVSYMDTIGLGEFALNPMYDTGSVTNVVTQEQKSELITIDYSEDTNGLEQIFEINSEENDLVQLTVEEPVSLTVKEYNGYNYRIFESQIIQYALSKLMNDVSEFTVSAWVKPDYSSCSSECTIISKENAFKLSINNVKTPENIVKFSVFNGFKWTTIESYSVVGEEWSHVAAKLDGQTISLYLNGNLEATKQIEKIPILNSYGYVELGPIAGISSDSPILFGAQQTSRTDDVSTHGFFSGQIDEIVIDNHSFTDEEIVELCENSHYDLA